MREKERLIFNKRRISIYSRSSKFLSFRIPLGVVVRVIRFSSVYPSSILLENDVLQGRREISSFFKMKKDIKVGGIHCPQPIF